MLKLKFITNYSNLALEKFKKLNLFERIETYKHINKILLFNVSVAVISLYGIYYFTSEKTNLEAQRAERKEPAPMAFLMKGPNLEQIKDWLLAISKVSIKGLWLTNIAYEDEKKILSINIKAVDQLDIYKYTTMLGGSLRTKKLCLLESDIIKKDEKVAIEKKNTGEKKKVPFVLAYLAKKKAEQGDKKDDGKNKDADEAIRWQYNYQADLKFGSCF